MARTKRREKLLDSIFICVLNIILPTLDVYSDLVFIITHLHYKVFILCIIISFALKFVRDHTFLFLFFVLAHHCNQMYPQCLIFISSCRC